MPFKSDKQRKGFFSKFQELKDKRAKARSVKLEQDIFQEKKELQREEVKLKKAQVQAATRQKLADTKAGIKKAKSEQFALTRRGKLLARAKRGTVVIAKAEKKAFLKQQKAVRKFAKKIWK